MGSRPRERAYGTWPSPLTPEVVLAGGRSTHSPWLDGDRLFLLESRPDEGGRTVIVRRLEDGSYTDVTPPGFNVRSRVHEYGGGAYTVADGEVVFSSFADRLLWRQATPGATPEPLTRDGTQRFADLTIDRRRGRVLAVLEDHGAGDHEPENALAAVALADGAVTRLVTGHDFFSDPRLDPTGDRLAWIAWDRPRMAWDGTELWVASLDADGAVAERTLVAGGPAESVLCPTWAPDGSLIFVSDRSGWWNPYRWRPGEPAVPLSPMAAETGGALWVFGDRWLGIDGDGTIVAVARADGRDTLGVVAEGRFRPIPLEATALAGLLVRDGWAWVMAGGPTATTALLRVELASGRTETVRPGRPLPVERAWLSAPRHRTFPSMDGRATHAWYYPPANPDAVAPAGERPPLIVLTHGGPTSAARTTLDLELQAFTSRGFAVVDVDYGGSTGYGRPYRELLNGRWGIVDVEDCVAVVRGLVAEGLADPARVAIRGGSAGGYTTLRALTTTDVFRAGCSAYGIGDLAALTTDTHKFESSYTDNLIAPWPSGEAVYRERSPIHAVDRIACPVLVLQGEDDRVVPREQAEAIVAALAARGIPYAYLLFAGEGHGFRQAANRRRALEAELSFYAQVFGFALADPIEPVELVRPAG